MCGRYDVAVVGGGIAGMATAARLQGRGLRTIVLEAHGLPGGCAGYYRRSGFSFDVGATTLVDFEPGGVGGQLLDEIGMPPLAGDALPGYVAWLPDRRATLHRDRRAWHEERLRVFGSSEAHRAFWRLLDELADVFWAASRRGIKLPIRSVDDIGRAAHAIGVKKLPLVRYAFWTVGDALNAFGLARDEALIGLLSMLIEDTVHSTVERAPLLNAALGITIRGAGLTRPRGGMRGFWQALASSYRAAGGTLKVGWRVDRVGRERGGYVLLTRKGQVAADQVVSSLPIESTTAVAPFMRSALRPHLERNEDALGGAVVVFLGVPECEVEAQELTHHQLLQSYARPLGDGNNMFVSVSAPGDIDSAPPGHRAVMISTHCELAPWNRAGAEAYEGRKRAAGEQLVELARRVYPTLGERAVVCEVATPRTYARFARRPQGAVGGLKQTLRNANQRAVPHDLGPHGFWLVGDTTWPGLGTVACVLGSRIVADGVTGLAEPSRRRVSIPRSPLAAAAEAA